MHEVAWAAGDEAEGSERRRSVVSGVVVGRGWEVAGLRAVGSKVGESQPGKVTVPARARPSPHRLTSPPTTP